jgi:uncharacterized protein with PIN domain
VIDWGLLRCAFGLHDWVPYPSNYHEDVLSCTRCTHLYWRYGAIEKALRRHEREKRVDDTGGRTT